MTDEILNINDLNIVYESDGEVVEAVNGISFKLNRGETLGIVGETGAGKTTTALSIMRLLPEKTSRITSGDIVFSGVGLRDLNKKEMLKYRGNKISMIFQDPMTSLNPVLTVNEQIAEAIELHMDMSKEEIDDKVDQMLELVGISPKRKNEYPHQFSGGMKQRVVIAIALACDPELLIADEPTTALDVTIQAQVLDMMEDLKNKFHTSMIMITHDLGVVAQICDKVAIMYAGEIVEYGSVEDIFENENHHPYTRGLFGAIPNLSVETRRLNTIRGLMPDPTNLPEGCKFSPRCDDCMEICRKIDPAYYTDSTHRIKCHLYND